MVIASVFEGGNNMRVLVAYDGTLDSKTALRYGLEKIKQNGGDLFVLHVFNSNLFVDYDAIPEAKEIAQRESSRYVKEAEMIIKEEGKGVKVNIIEEEGDPEKETVRYATHENIDIIISPPRYKSIVKKAPCRVSIIPGTILIPLDNEDNSIMTIDQIVKEAKAMSSKVVLLGLVPIHIYGRWEKSEIDKITEEITSVVKNLKKILIEQGVETKEIIRSGYPDEEILKVASENPVSMIIFLTRGHKPSELNKAVTILLDESDRLKMPVLSLSENSKGNTKSL